MLILSDGLSILKNNFVMAKLSELVHILKCRGPIFYFKAGLDIFCLAYISDIFSFFGRVLFSVDLLFLMDFLSKKCVLFVLWLLKLNITCQKMIFNEK